MKQHGFKASLEKGKQGELKLLKLWPNLTRTSGRSGDYILPSGKRVETKCDFYDHSSTGNFFIEFWSDVENKKPGGPAQALLHNCFYFVYYFASHDIAYIFETEALVEQLKSAELGEPVYVLNRGWTTVGYKIPRTALKPVFVLTKKNMKENPCK